MIILIKLFIGIPVLVPRALVIKLKYYLVVDFSFYCTCPVQYRLFSCSFELWCQIDLGEGRECGYGNVSGPSIRLRKGVRESVMLDLLYMHRRHN